MSNSSDESEPDLSYDGSKSVLSYPNIKMTAPENNVDDDFFEDANKNEPDFHRGVKRKRKSSFKKQETETSAQFDAEVKGTAAAKTKKKTGKFTTYYNCDEFL